MVVVVAAVATAAAAKDGAGVPVVAVAAVAAASAPANGLGAASNTMARATEGVALVLLLPLRPCDRGAVHTPGETGDVSPCAAEPGASACVCCDGGCCISCGELKGLTPVPRSRTGVKRRSYVPSLLASGGGGGDAAPAAAMDAVNDVGVIGMVNGRSGDGDTSRASCCRPISAAAAAAAATCGSNVRWCKPCCCSGTARMRAGEPRSGPQAVHTGAADCGGRVGSRTGVQWEVARLEVSANLGHQLVAG